MVQCPQGKGFQLVGIVGAKGFHVENRGGSSDGPTKSRHVGREAADVSRRGGACHISYQGNDAELITTIKACVSVNPDARRALTCRLRWNNTFQYSLGVEYQSNPCVVLRRKPSEFIPLTTV